MNRLNLIAFLTLFNVFFISGQLSRLKNNAESFLYSDNFRGYLEVHKMDMNSAIKQLMNFSLGDTIQDKDIWYSYNSIDSVWSQRSTSINSKFYASLKLKSYYWVLKIMNSNYSNDQKKQVIVFFDKKKREIFDYELIAFSQQEESIKRILEKQDSTLRKYQYKARKSTEYQVLENVFIKWFEIFQIKGLKYMKRHKLYPINENHYEIIHQNIY